MSPELTSFLIQAGATLAGAFAAFRLEARHQDQREARDRLASLKRAIFTLASQRTFIINLKGQQLDALTGDARRAFLLQPIAVLPARLVLDVGALTFLLDTVDADLLNAIDVADLRFRTVVGVLEKRSRVHENFQQRFEAVQVSTGLDVIDLESLRRAVGPVVSSQLEQLTDELYTLTESALTMNRDVHGRIELAFGRLYPGEKLFVVEELPTAPAPAPATAPAPPKATPGTN